MFAKGKYIYSDKANKERVLVQRYFCTSDDSVYFSSPTESKDEFLKQHNNYTLCGEAKLYPRGSDNSSYVDFNTSSGTSSDNKQFFLEHKDDIQSVLSDLKAEFGFRYTTTMKVGGTAVRDVELQAPMNIGHVLRNPYPETEMAESKSDDMKKEAQQTKQPIAAFRMDGQGRVELLEPRKYVYPIEVPQEIAGEADDPEHSNRREYLVTAVTDNGREVQVRFRSTPTEVGLVVPQIQHWATEWQIRKNGNQQQSPQQQVQPQQPQQPQQQQQPQPQQPQQQQQQPQPQPQPQPQQPQQQQPQVQPQQHVAPFPITASKK